MNLQLLSRILAQPWAIQREALALFSRLVLAQEHGSERTAAPQLLTFKARAVGSSLPGIAGIKAAGKASRRIHTCDGQLEQFAQAGYLPLNDEAWSAAAQENLPPVPAGVTVLLIWGPLGRGWSSWEKYWLDAVDYDDITRAVETSQEGGRVVLWMRSPGGVITGCPETAAGLRSFARKRTLLAFTDTLCASAAYWLAAQCARIDSTMTADVGSIGVYCAFYDFCEYLTQNGIKLELFKAGTMKGTGLPGNPLSDEEREHLQQGVADAYADFTRDVLKNREISAEHMQGQCLSGSATRKANLVDDNGWHSAADYFAGLARGKVA